mgnify:CR=1 FL=1
MSQPQPQPSSRRFVVHDLTKQKGHADFAREVRASILERIRTEKAISKENDADLRRAISGFGQSFGSGAEGAARPALAGAGR